MDHKPRQVQRIAGNLNDGQSYERRVLLFVASALSQDEEVKDFWIVSNPTGIDKIDDVVLRVSFKDNNKNDIALFIQAKLSRSDDKVLWLNLHPKKTKQKNSQKFEIKLFEYEAAFYEVIHLMGIKNKQPQTEAMRLLLRDVDVKDYFACIFTNMKHVDPQLNCRRFVKGDPIYFLDTRGVGQCQQFDYENENFDSDFYKQFYVFLEQPTFKAIDSTIANLLGNEYKNKIENLDKIVKEFMQNDDYCNVLTKAHFEEQWLKVLLDEWMRTDLEQIQDINPEFIPLWQKLFSGQAIIKLDDEDKIWPLLACYYQYIIRQMDKNFNWHDKNVVDMRELLFSLWCEKKIHIPIKTDCTRKVLRFLHKYETIEQRFIVFTSDDYPELIDSLDQITDPQVLMAAKNVKVSLQGRPLVVLQDIAEGSMSGLLKNVKISQLLTWTRNTDDENHYIFGPALRKPSGDNYITKNFIEKARKQEDMQDQKENVLTVKDVLNITKPGLHIITGDPGIGKSTVLQELAHKYSPKDFVIFVVLKDCLHDIENDDIWPCIEADPLQYFFDKVTDNKRHNIITQSIFQIHKTSRRLCLFLDGYDEILPLHGNQIYSMMVNILDSTPIPIFCTSRPHAEEQITNRPETICLELLPLTREQIEQFLAYHKIDAEHIREQFAENFLSNPLHLNMISQICKEPGKYQDMTRGKMFKIFIDLKHKTYNKKMGLPLNCTQVETKISMKNHRKLALVDIFGKECVTSKKVITDFEFSEILEEIRDQNIGIIDARKSSSMFQFRHRTFAEYLVADWFLLTSTNEDSVGKDHMKYFYQVVVENNSYRDIYCMLNEISRNFAIWSKAIKRSSTNSDVFMLDEFGRNVAHVQYWYLRAINPTDNPYDFEWLNTVYRSRLSYRKDSVLQWTCQEFRSGYPTVNITVYAINDEYPECRPVTNEDENIYTKLLTAIDDENMNEIKSILDTHLSLLDTGIGIIAFHSAITTGNKNIVRLLLELKPVLVNKGDVYHNTALHIACAFGYRDIIALLLENHALLDKGNSGAFTPLQMAAAEGQLEIVALLLNRITNTSVTGNVSSKDKLLWTTLTAACMKGQTGIVDWLLDRGADPTLSDSYGWTALHYAAQEGHSNVIKILLKAELNVNAKTTRDETALIFASRKKYWDTVKLLLYHGADAVMSVDVDQWTPMHHAAADGELEIVKLLTGKCNLNSKTGYGLSPLMIASKNRHWDIVKFLLDHDGDAALAGVDGWTALHYAADAGQLDIIKTFLEKGLGINAETNCGDTALNLTCGNGHWSTFKWLLSRGADPNITRKDGWTPMHFAARDGQVEILELLLNMNLNINEMTNRKDTPLTLACTKRQWSVVEWLLEHGADATLTANNFAAKAGKLEILKLLSERGFDVNVKSNTGEPPLTLAIRDKD